MLATDNAKSDKDLDLTKQNTWQILHDGDSLHIRGLVDRRGLNKLIKTLTGYKAVLEAGSDDDTEGANS